MLLFFSGCTSSHKEKPSNSDVEKKDGTYQVVIPAASSPGHYMLLALNDNQYQLFEKYLGEATTFYSEGELSDVTDSTFQVNDYRVSIRHGKLYINENVFRKVSSLTSLDQAYREHILKDQTTGENVSLCLKSDDDEKVAVLVMGDKTYTLKAKDDVFTDGKATLTLTDTPDYQDSKLVIDGKTHTFDALGPNTKTYTSEDKDVPYIEAFYYAGEKGGLVRLFGYDEKDCMELPLKEAAAHAALYTNNEQVSWAVRPDNSATLSVKGKNIVFKEKN